MGGLHVFVFILLGVVSCCRAWISRSEVIIHPGYNITLYCDCKSSAGVYIVWYRNCSHENQPSLVLKVISENWMSRGNIYKLSSHFQFVRNSTSESYDLLILNITHFDEGLYCCGTEKKQVEDKNCITSRYIYRYGNTTTRILLDSSKANESNENPQKCDKFWILLVCLCPALAGLSSLFSSLLVYYLCRKRHSCKEPDVEQQSPKTRNLTRLNQDEDVCYAALEIRQASQRPKKKTQSSDFSTYSAINTSRV